MPEAKDQRVDIKMTYGPDGKTTVLVLLSEQALTPSVVRDALEQYLNLPFWGAKDVTE